ncbi:MAG TPA: UbiA family prenyltransferase [Kiritimatiellia bacterium]|nr:UbiA family prenyltransferase [Kiritimatiellia bacterium]HMP33366.1 UbiA family prenyltransferase [Kiritimatiellia bacterium]
MSDVVPVRHAPNGIVRALLLTMAWPAAAAVSLAVAIAGDRVTPGGLLLLASGTMAAYGLDRLVDRWRLEPADLRRALVMAVAATAAATAVLAGTSWWRFQVCVALSLIAAAYVPLKRHIPKNLLTTFAWTAATATLPLAVRPELDARYALSIASVACIMAANTILCDIPDVAQDRQCGVRGLTPRFGARAGAVAAIMFGLLGMVASVRSGHPGLAVTSASLAMLGVLQARARGRGLHRYLADGLVTALPGPLHLLLG